MKIPLYVGEMIPRLRVIIDYEGCDKELCTDYIGYVYELKGKYPFGKNSLLGYDAERLVEWAKRQGATLSRYIDAKWHCRNEQRRGKYDRAYVILTDPVSGEIDRLKLEHNRIRQSEPGHLHSIKDKWLDHLHSLRPTSV